MANENTNRFVDDGIYYYIATIIDGTVYDVMMCKENTKELYLSNPTFVMVPEGQTVDKGYTYDGSNFHFGHYEYFPDPE